jgi:hypothetical protein
MECYMYDLVVHTSDQVKANSTCSLFFVQEALTRLYSAEYLVATKKETLRQASYSSFQKTKERTKISSSISKIWENPDF